MSKISPLSRPLPDASLPRNAFDRGFSSKVNFSAGMLLPLFSQFVLGGSNCRINLRSLVRTADINTAAMTKFDIHCDFYAVPIRQLFTLWGTFKTRTNDVHSSIFSPGGTYPFTPSTIPAIPASTLNQYALQHSEMVPDYSGMQHGNLNMLRLLDVLRYGVSFKQGPAYNTFADINPLRLCAYQKIYYSFYRNSSYESNNPVAYNLDQFCNLTQGTSRVVDPVSAAQMLRLRFVNYRKDAIRSLYPSLNYIQAGNGQALRWTVPTSVVGQIGFGANVESYDQASSPIENNPFHIPVTNASQHTSATSPFGGFAGAFNVQNIRAAFALDKLMRASSYAPQHVKDQFAARFGFSPSLGSADEPIRLGSYMFDVNLGEVISTADVDPTSSSGRLGSIGGRGIGSFNGGDTINYNAKDDCIVMGVIYAMPRLTYDSDLIDAFNFKFTPEDYFVPEFMNMGLQPLYMKQYHQLSDNESVEDDVLSFNNRILGYQERYMEYKSNVDMNHGLFQHGNALGIFTTHGNLSHGVPLTPGQDANGVSSEFFRVLPSDVNSLFVTAYDGTLLSDQFYGVFDFRFDVNQNMSVHGQPRL